MLHQCCSCQQTLQLTVVPFAALHTFMCTSICWIQICMFKVYLGTHGPHRKNANFSSICIFVIRNQILPTRSSLQKLLNVPTHISRTTVTLKRSHNSITGTKVIAFACLVSALQMLTLRKQYSRECAVATEPPQNQKACQSHPGDIFTIS